MTRLGDVIFAVFVLKDWPQGNLSVLLFHASSNAGCAVLPRLLIDRAVHTQGTFYQFFGWVVMKKEPRRHV